MKANIYDNPLRRREMPKGEFKRPNGQVVSGYEHYSEYFFIDGFRDIITPDYNPETEELGLLEKIGDDIYYSIVPKDIPTEEEIAEKKLQGIKEQYEDHKQKGWDAYQEFRGKIVIDIENEVLTLEQAFHIEAVLSIAYNRISSTGDWKTAQFELSQVTPAGFVIPYYDLAMQEIALYITENYT
tara:strand:- start:25040 stop:25591 length:552 start_codon:yes stop_codon:yes gene_type:complete